MRNGVTSTTFENLVIGPGVVYKGFISPASPGTIVGATSGGNNVRITRQYFAPEIDGVLGPVKGSQRLISEIPSVTARFIDITKDNLMLALTGTTSATAGATHDKITSPGKISDGNYQDIAIVGDVSGKTNPIIFVVKNAISTDPVEIALGTGKEEVALAITFTGNYDKTNPTTAPYEIYSPLA